MVNNKPTENGFLSRIKKSIRDVIFGLEDGLVSTLGVVIGIAEGSRSSYVVILSGIVVVFVEALSMAAGTYLSAKSHKEVLEEKIQEVKEGLGGISERKSRLEKIYKEHGLNEDNAKVLATRAAEDEKVWLEEIKLHELGIGREEMQNPKINAFFMWISYVVAGFIPVVAFFFFSVDLAIVFSIVFTVVALFLIGAGKTFFTKKNWFKSGLEMTSIALAAAVLGFVIGKVVSYFY